MKILEFMVKQFLAPVGGPYGYVHALYECDKKSNNNYLHFIDDSEKVVDYSKKNRLYMKLRDKIGMIHLLIKGNRSSLIESNQYDIIHFHDTFSLFKYRKSLKKYKGKIVLTSHSPTLASIERKDSASSLEKFLFWWLYLLIRKVDYRAFEIATYIVFPCEEAEEPYSHAWKGFASFKENNKNKFKYLLTGTFRRKATVSNSDIRAKLNIPKTAKVICFVGRHNAIKGYDRLKIIAESILNGNDNVYFLIVGKEEPLHRLNNTRWIEIGWTDDPHSYIASSDIFVLPNRETYFDLVLLEVLSLGKTILASNTGGNKFFRDKNCGIFLFNTTEQAISIINELLTSFDLEKTGQKNVALFNEYFTDRIFYESYIELMKSLCSLDKSND